MFFLETYQKPLPSLVKQNRDDFTGACMKMKTLNRCGNASVSASICPTILIRARTHKTSLQVACKQQLSPCPLAQPRCLVRHQTQPLSWGAVLPAPWTGSRCLVLWDMLKREDGNYKNTHEISAWVTQWPYQNNATQRGPKFVLAATLKTTLYS